MSVGEADHTKTMMKKLGDVAFWKIAMYLASRHWPWDVFQATNWRQGLMKYAWIAIKIITSHQYHHAILFGLPGNPVAVMVTFLAFVRPALLQMMGCKDGPPPLLKARSVEVIRKKPGRTEYQRGTVSMAPDGSLQVRTTLTRAPVY